MTATFMVLWLAEELLVALQIAEPEIKSRPSSSPGGSRYSLLSQRRGKIFIKGQLSSSQVDAQLMKSLLFHK